MYGDFGVALPRGLGDLPAGTRVQKELSGPDLRGNRG